MAKPRFKTVQYIGSSESQVRWGGNDDPSTCLVVGKRYKLLREEVRSWHTKYVLCDFPDKRFNSCSFSPSRIGEGWNAYDAEAVKP